MGRIDSQNYDFDDYYKDYGQMDADADDDDDLQGLLWR